MMAGRARSLVRVQGVQVNMNKPFSFIPQDERSEHTFLSSRVASEASECRSTQPHIPESRITVTN